MTLLKLSQMHMETMHQIKLLSKRIYRFSEDRDNIQNDIRSGRMITLNFK